MKTVVSIEKNRMVQAGIRYELSRDAGFALLEFRDLNPASLSFENSPPDVVIVDLNSIRLGPFRQLMHIRARFPETRLILVTTGRQFAVAQSALEIGVSGIVSKDGLAREYLDAVRATLRGKLYISPEIIQSQRTRGQESEEPLRLTSREIDVLVGLIHGCSTRDVAHVWNVKYGTILKDLEFLREKFSVSSMNELVRTVFDNRFVSMALMLAA